MSEPSAPLRRFGNYEILGLLGRGGMAEVYRARVVDGPRRDWQVAIKRLLPKLAQIPEYVEMFAGEADLTRLLDHPNVVKVYEVGVIDEVYFIAMELIDGRDLGQVLRRCKERGIPWPIDFAVYLGHLLCGALAYVHAAKGPSGKPLNIVHRDVSPSNLFISRVGDIKLGDFGVAGARAGADNPSVVGKPYYLAPEALDGDVSTATDVWATVVTLYELLTLERPFQGESADDVFDAIRTQRHTPVQRLRPEVPDAIAKVIAKGFARRPQDRFQSAEALGAALAPLYDERVGTPLAIAAVVRGLFGTGETPKPK